MTADIPNETPLSGSDEPQIIAHFVDEDGDVVSRWSATNLPIPSRHETVSFGELRSPSTDELTGKDAQYSFEEPVYTVIDVEYSYSRTTTEGDEDDPDDNFVLVTVYLEETTTKY